MRPILQKKAKILILDYFFEFECLDMLDNADYDSTNGLFSFGNHELRGLRAKICKIRLIMHKKVKILIFDQFFDLESLILLDNADFDMPD